MYIVVCLHMFINLEPCFLPDGSWPCNERQNRSIRAPTGTQRGSRSADIALILIGAILSATDQHYKVRAGPSGVVESLRNHYHGPCITSISQVSVNNPSFKIHEGDHLAHGKTISKQQTSPVRRFSYSHPLHSGCMTQNIAGGQCSSYVFGFLKYINIIYKIKGNDRRILLGHHLLILLHTFSNFV